MGYWRNKPFNNRRKEMDLSNLLNDVALPVEQDGEKKALPQGSYNVVIEKVEPKTNMESGNKGISLQMRVFGEKFNNYCLFDYMGITGSEKQLEYSLPKLKKVGLLCDSNDTSKWLGKKVSVRISVDKNDDTRNIIWGYSDAVVSDNTSMLSGANTSANISASDLPF